MGFGSLDEFVAMTGFHGKHAMRLLRSGATGQTRNGRAGRCVYGEAVREALVVLWEASDRTVRAGASCVPV